MSEIPEEIAFGNVRIDSKALRGKRGREAFDLTPRELKVLAVLWRERGNAVARDATGMARERVGRRDGGGGRRVPGGGRPRR